MIAVRNIEVAKPLRGRVVIPTRKLFAVISLVIISGAVLFTDVMSVSAFAADVPSTTPSAPTTTVRGRIEVASAGQKDKKRRAPLPPTVVWLTPIATANNDSALVMPPLAPVSGLRLVQKDKSFQPHLLVVPAGSVVEFPNRDPFFHNVFSLFEGKRFDLGLYEAGTSRMVRFDRPGISYIFCNIHPEMSAVVITLSTPLYAISKPDGQISVAGVPFGRYMMHVWSEGMGAGNAHPFSREITITPNASSFGVIRVPEFSGMTMAHKNKYGRDYDDPTPDDSAYEQQPR